MATLSNDELKKALREKLDEVRTSVRHSQELILQLENTLRCLDIAFPSKEDVTNGLRLTRVYIPPVDAHAILSVKSVGDAQFPVEKIKGMTQLDAAVTVAKHYGGVLRTADLIKILKAAGLMKGNTKNAGSKTFGVINNSGLFERVATGTYKLIEQEDDPSNSQEHFVSTRQIQ